MIFLLDLKYDPDGSRIWKDSSPTVRKYIVDIVADLPVILMELDQNENIMKSYIYENSRIIAQHAGGAPAQNNQYFFLHDRLGSVRQIIDYDDNPTPTVDVIRMYTYEPFGEVLETDGTFDNPFMFTGQYFDSEVDQYYLRARQYSPHVSRFTSRDPVFGQFEDPLTLHKYLYCENDPVNLLDPNGASSRAYSQYGIEPWSLEVWTALWNAKRDPFETNLIIIGIYGALDLLVTTVTDNPALKVFSTGAGAIACMPNMYLIARSQLLYHGLINAVLYEFFGQDPLSANDLYDYQDYLSGL